ncbi:carbohydrate ABC transporter permease [Thermoanaerobacter uzonensis]|uniref:carbohydrate ABC transporter permease n=1 Tax=Thermoanaerobacter uzonensis TaxID=447593 RepID=UPI003D767271
MKNKENNSKKFFFNTLWYITVILLSIIMLMPFYWTIITSIRPNDEMFTQPIKWIPTHITFEHYKEVFNAVPFARYFLNSAILGLGGVLTNLFFGSLAGYAFAKLNFKGKKTLFVTLLSSMMIPGIVTMIPSFLVLKHFPLVGGNNILGQGGNGFINTYWAILLPGAAGAFAVFFMRQFFLTLPDELADAARIDGCSEFEIFLRIYFPLTKPALATLGIMTFQAGWNSFLWPLIVLNSQEMMTIQVGLAAFTYNYGANYGPLMAGTVIATLPMLVVFMYAQKYFIQGIAFSGIKN